MGTVGRVIAVMLLVVGANAVVARQLRAGLHTDQALPADVRAEVDAVWDSFVTTFSARQRCTDDVELLLVEDVAGGDARYVIAERRIEIQIPTSPGRFRESLAHELAHHVEYTCGSFHELRTAFLVLDGVEGRPWHGEGVWEDTPAELYAEAVVVLLTGERVRHGDAMALPEGATALVERWAAGRSD